MALLLALVFLVFSLPATAITQAEGHEQGTTILLTFTGDCTLGNEERLMHHPRAFTNVVKKEGMGYPFAHLKDLFAKDDLTIINLESVFFDKNTNQADKNYVFRAPVAYADILTEGSIELAFLANNHIMDYGLPGLNSTISALEERQVGWFGNNFQLDQTFIYEKNGVKLGFVGTYYSYFGVHFAKVRAAIKGLQQAGCHAIIGIMHDGVEYWANRSNKQERMSSWFLNNGVDLVLGHHPHVPQGIDILDGKSVVYSLGNCSFGGNQELDIARRPGQRADKALLAQVTLRFDEQANYLGHQLNLIPISPSSTDVHNNYQPILLQGDMALETLRLVQADTPFPLAPFQEGLGAVQAFVPAQPRAEEASSPGN